MPSKPVWRDLALATLREHGPMSKNDLMELLGDKGKAAGNAIATARHERPGEFFRVVRYDVQRGRGGREIPIYSADGGKDAPRPDFASVQARKDRQNRYYANNRAQIIAKLHAKRRGAQNAGMWMSLLAPKDRRDIVNSVRMREKNPMASAK